jgi:SAM-dependent methyltransferase
MGANQGGLLGAVLQFLNAAFCARLALALLLCAAGAPSRAQAPRAAPHEPQLDQPGKDVIWEPTASPLVEKMLDMARVTREDFVIDLGSGDGRIVIAAARRGARALGIEYDANLVELSRARAQQAGVDARAEFRKADLFETDLSPATVITMFLLPEINLKLRPKLLALKPGTRIVSNSFTMGPWEPDESADILPEGGCESWCEAHLWIVPAKVAGSYKLAQGELTLTQEFQLLHGTLAQNDRILEIEDGRVRGEELSFRAGGTPYRGRITAGTLTLD